MKELDQLLSDFEARQRTRNESLEQKEHREEQERNKSREVLERLILPVLQEISSGIVKKGYRSEVRQRLKGFLSPNIELAFSPIRGNGLPVGCLPWSVLSFIHSNSGQIEIRQEVKATDHASPSRSFESAIQVSIESLSEEMVRASALSFLSSVLEIN